MKTLVFSIMLMTLLGCGEVEKEKSEITKKGDVIPGTGLPLVSVELKEKLKKITTEVSDFETSLNSSDVIKVVLPGDSSKSLMELSDNGEVFETSVQSAVESDQCLVTVSPSPELPNFDYDLPNYELRMTDSSALAECPIYFYNFITTSEQKSLNRLVKNRSFNLVVDEALGLFENVDLTSYNYSGTSTFVEPPQNSELKYRSDLEVSSRGFFVSKVEGKILFDNKNTHTLTRNRLNGANFLSSQKTSTINLLLEVDEKKVNVIGHRELSLVDQNGETTIEDKFYINGEEISKSDFLNIFSFGITPWEF